VIENQYRGFARDPRNLSIKKDIGDHVPENDNFFPPEAFNDLPERTHQRVPEITASTACMRFSATRCG
jgi:hypothetical protein